MGAVVTPLGGGGHTFAAAATIRGKTIAQIEYELLEILYKTVRSRSRAKDLMSSPAITVDADVPCKNAGDLLTRYNINALLVTQKYDAKKNLVVFITRQIIEKVMFHGLDQIPVKEYMTTELASVERDSELQEIREKIIENKQRLLPVIDNEIIIGVITRTDLFNILVRQSDHTDQVHPIRLRNMVHAKNQKHR